MRGRKASGGKYKKLGKRKLRERAGKVRNVRLTTQKKKKLKMRGGGKRTVLLAIDKANIFDIKTKKCKSAKIKNVIETPSNRFLARQNILTKGAIIDTELGRARITNRPSQEAVVNAVLIEEAK